MTIKLNSLARWAQLQADSAIVFVGEAGAERRVRLNLNLEAVTTLFIGEKQGERMLVTCGPGLETVEFNAAGDFRIYAEKGSGLVYYQSADLEPTHTEIANPVIFTRIANRRHRNPELEEMMYRMQMNMERRLAQQASEVEAALMRRREEEANARPAEVAKSDAPGAVARTGAAEIPEPVAQSANAGATPGSADAGKPAGTPAPTGG